MFDFVLDNNRAIYANMNLHVGGGGTEYTNSSFTNIIDLIFIFYSKNKLIVTISTSPCSDYSGRFPGPPSSILPYALSAPD